MYTHTLKGVSKTAEFTFLILELVICVKDKIVTTQIKIKWVYLAAQCIAYLLRVAKNLQKILV